MFTIEGNIYIFRVITYDSHISSKFTCIFLWLCTCYAFLFIINYHQNYFIGCSTTTTTTKSVFNSASYSSKNITGHDKKSHAEHEEIKFIRTRPEISRYFSPIGRNIEIPQTHCFSESKLDSNWQSFGQQYSSYYQPQPDTYNQRQRYHHDIITQQDPYITDYDRDNVVKHGNIHSGIPSPDIKNTHYSIEKYFLFKK